MPFLVYQVKGRKLAVGNRRIPRLRNYPLNMRYGIFSDVHSNLPALEAVLAAYATEGIDEYVCVGDIVGYAADPEECIRKIKQLNPLLVAGNHDWACVD